MDQLAFSILCTNPHYLTIVYQDVLEDIESNAKKMQRDINTNLHNFQSIQYEKMQSLENEDESSYGEDDSDTSSGNYSDKALEIDSNNYDFDCFDQMLPDDEDGDGLTEIAMRRMDIEEKKKLTSQRGRNKLERLDSNKSGRSNKSGKSEGDVNGQPGNSPFKAHSFFVKKKRRACNKAVRLALLEAGPFRQLLKEGVKVSHCC